MPAVKLPCPVLRVDETKDILENEVKCQDIMIKFLYFFAGTPTSFLKTRQK